MRGGSHKINKRMILQLLVTRSCNINEQYIGTLVCRSMSRQRDDRWQEIMHGQSSVNNQAEMFSDQDL